jgi:hypothetical protein
MFSSLVLWYCFFFGQTFLQYIEQDAEGHDSSSDDDDDDDDDKVGDAVPLVSLKIDQVRLPSKLIWICADCTSNQASL